MSRPVILLVFANDETIPLNKLNDELTLIQKLLDSASLNQEHFNIVALPQATHDILWEYLDRYGEQIWLIHYAGHANQEQLLLSSGPANSEGFSQRLRDLRSLKLVFLNGCSTETHVQGMLKSGVPVVIGTREPIEDDSASKFAGKFYQSLCSRGTFEQAYHSACSFIKTLSGKSSNDEIPIFRSLILEEEDMKIDGEAWGMYCHPEKVNALSERLPHTNSPQIFVLEDFEPNDFLIDYIWESFLSNNIEEVLNINEQEDYDDSEVNMQIINQFPAPIGEQLRKLLVPMGQENDNKERYNQIGFKRLNQLSYLYEVVMDLLSFIYLAQLWENKILEKDINVPEDILAIIKLFFQTEKKTKKVFFYIPFMEKLRLALDLFESLPIINELSDITELMSYHSDFYNSCTYFDFLRERVHSMGEKDSQLQSDIERLCKEAEQNMGIILRELGFLANYDLNTIENIRVQKTRNESAEFHHTIVQLSNVLGGMSKKAKVYDFYLDSQSVILQRKADNQRTSVLLENERRFLNLSPFIFDENAFVAYTDTTKIYFFDHYHTPSMSWVYRDVNTSKIDGFKVSLKDKAIGRTSRNSPSRRKKIKTLSAKEELKKQISEFMKAIGL